MTRKLFFQAILKFTLGAVMIGALLFLPAGTFRYWNGWLFMAIQIVLMFLAGIVMMVKERQAEQSPVIKLSGLMFLLGFIAAGLNFRFGWIVLPRWVSWLGNALFLLSYLLYAEVLSSSTPCTARPLSCSFPCRWCLVLFSPLSSFWRIGSLLQRESETRRRCWKGIWQDTPNIKKITYKMISLVW